MLVDDEPLARERLRMLLAKHPQWSVAAECEDGRAAVAAIVREQPDAVLLDIRMPELDGTGVVRAVHDAWPAGRTPPAIVFITAYDAHAVEAFELAAIDYLLKPVDAERLAMALARLEARIPAPRPTRFLARDAKGVAYFVGADQVAWAEARGNYVRLHAGGRAHFVRETITRLTELLDPTRFARIHRSTVVALDEVQRIEARVHGAYVVTLRDGTRLPSSRRHGAALRELLGRKVARRAR